MNSSKETMFNPSLMLGIGLFPLLVVSTTIKMSLAYAVLMFLSLCLSYLIVGLFKPIIPHRVRFICYALTLLCGVYFFDSALCELFPKYYESLQGLVVFLLASSIIFFLLETGLKKEKFGDGFKTIARLGGEYALTMVLVGLIREALGHGSLWGILITEDFDGFPFFNTLAGGVMILVILALIYNVVVHFIYKRIKLHKSLKERYLAVIESKVDIKDLKPEDEFNETNEVKEVE